MSVRSSAIVLIGLVTSSCSFLAPGPDVGAAVVTTTSVATTIPTTTTTTLPPRVCLPRDIGDATIAGGTLSDVSLALSQATFECSDEVVIAPATPRNALTTAADLAERHGAPLLILTGDNEQAVVTEVERLAPLSASLVGVELPESLADPALDIVRVPTDSSAKAPQAPTESRVVWIVAKTNASIRTLVSAYAAQVGARLVVPEQEDLRAMAQGPRSAVARADSVAVIGDLGPDADWQLATVRRGLEEPGGGQMLFPGKRIVALYGSPYSPALGVLGEQGPEASVTRAQALAEGYATNDGVTVVPGFNLIATVASSGPGADGDYSAELSVDDIRPWVDAAAGGGVYVIIDLQPGRTDFLTQAKRYEELLKLPNVGLALDPEWRLKPNQVHLRQIGSVSAGEINTVVEWLADLVRTEALPQKLLMIHQFKLTMITERDTLKTPPELAMVIQMDGQGPLGSKYGTYAAITRGEEDAGWRWGWKNFYDEDTPTATPEQTLAVDPQPVYISYQ